MLLFLLAFLSPSVSAATVSSADASIVYNCPTRLTADTAYINQCPPTDSGGSALVSSDVDLSYFNAPQSYDLQSAAILITCSYDARDCVYIAGAGKAPESYTDDPDCPSYTTAAPLPSAYFRRREDTPTPPSGTCPWSSNKRPYTYHVDLTADGPEYTLQCRVAFTDDDYTECAYTQDGANNFVPGENNDSKCPLSTCPIGGSTSDKPSRRGYVYDEVVLERGKRQVNTRKLREKLGRAGRQISSGPTATYRERDSW